MVQVPCATFFDGVKVTVELIVPPCRLSTDGEMEQSDPAGPPEHVNATDPVKPAIGVTLMVYVAVCPEDIVWLEGDTVIEKLPLMVIDTVFVTLT